MDDATGLAEALVGLDGFRVLDVRENPDEVCITVETSADLVGCPRCGVRALAKERKRVDIRDLPCFGRPARLVWLKRRWCCADPDCEQKTWTEGSPHVPVSLRAHRACRRRGHAPGGCARPPRRRRGSRARGVLVDRHGRRRAPRHPARRRSRSGGPVRALGIDETSFLSATREHATRLRDGHGRSRRPQGHRHDRGQQRR